MKGYRYSKGWARAQRVYFYAEFSKPFSDLHIHSIDYMPLYAKADFDTAEGEQILMKVAISPVSMEGAYANMQAELKGWDFDATAKAAEKAWNEELSRINVETKDETARKVFYTSLYHTMIAPSTVCDVDGSYRGADDKIHANPG